MDWICLKTKSKFVSINYPCFVLIKNKIFFNNGFKFILWKVFFFHASNFNIRHKYATVKYLSNYEKKGTEIYTRTISIFNAYSKYNNIFV
jgi:hypothetical protein